MADSSAYFTLAGIHNKHDKKKIKRELDALPGVCSVSISDSSNRIAVDFDATGIQADRIEKQLESMGYQILNPQPDRPST